MKQTITLETGDRICIKCGRRSVTFEAGENSIMIEDGIVHII